MTRRSAASYVCVIVSLIIMLCSIVAIYLDATVFMRLGYQFVPALQARVVWGKILVLVVGILALYFNRYSCVVAGWITLVISSFVWVTTTNDWSMFSYSIMQAPEIIYLIFAYIVLACTKYIRKKQCSIYPS